MKELKFKHRKSGIISLIINMPEKYMDYYTCINFARDTNGIPIIDEHVFEFFLESKDLNGFKELYAKADIDFDYRKYHKLEDFEKINLWFILFLLNGFCNKSESGQKHKFIF